jgi:RNA polymerase sigma-70 factor (ECF subfamily)
MAAGSVAASHAQALPDDADLFARCRDGDPAAQRAFYDRYARFILRTARRLGIPPEEIEDVTQEVFSIAFRKLDRFQGGQITTWLYRICSNRVQHHHSSRRVRQALARLFGAGVAQSEPAAQERVTERHEAERAVSAILARMSAKKREVLVMFEFEGLPGDVIAERVGCPEETVWTRLYHARREFARLARSQAFVERARSRR